MFSKMFIIILLGMVLGLQGCNTLKGAAVGVQKDWKSLQEADDWLEENLW